MHKTRGILLSHTYSAIFHTLFYQSVEVLKCQDISQKNRPAVTTVIQHLYLFRFGANRCFRVCAETELFCSYSAILGA